MPSLEYVKIVRLLARYARAPLATCNPRMAGQRTRIMMYVNITKVYHNKLQLKEQRTVVEKGIWMH